MNGVQMQLCGCIEQSDFKQLHFVVFFSLRKQQTHTHNWPWLIYCVTFLSRDLFLSSWSMLTFVYVHDSRDLNPKSSCRPILQPFSWLSITLAPVCIVFNVHLNAFTINIVNRYQKVVYQLLLFFIFCMEFMVYCPYCALKWNINCAYGLFYWARCDSRS